MRAAVVLATDADPPAVDETLSALSAFEERTVVCAPGERELLGDVLDADPRIVVDSVPHGGLVAAMRTGLRATSATRALVTTPAMPAVTDEAYTDLLPAAGTDVSLAMVDGERCPPLGGYAVDATRAACDTTLATGSRRLRNVLARLSVATTAVDGPAPGSDSGGPTASGRN